jgi:hypothetical protein
MQWLRRTASLALATSLLIASPAEAASDSYDAEKSRKQFHGLMVDAFYIRLAHCESGYTKDRGIDWAYQSRSYTGAFGIYRGTWKRWSNSSSAKDKPPRYQVAVVDNIAFRGFNRPDGTFKHPVGPWGWGSIKNNCGNLQRYICKAQHELVRKWRRNACG